MKSVLIGEARCRGVPIYVKEPAVTAQDLESGKAFTVTLTVKDTELSLNLSEVRNLKRLLNLAEQQILLRNEQATKAANLKLDI